MLMARLIRLRDPHGLTVGDEICFLLLEKRWANKSNHLLHSLPVTSFWIQNSSLGPREYCLMIVLLRGKMDPASPFFSCQQPLLCLHLNQVLGPKSAPGWFHYRPLSLQENHFLERAWGTPILNLRGKNWGREWTERMIFLPNIL